MSITNIFWLVKTTEALKQDQTPETIYGNYKYLSDNEVEALNWLKDNTKKETVLSNRHIGNYIPRMSGNKVFIGHWAQTIKFEQKIEIVNNFFNQDNEYRKSILKEYNIKYLYYGKDEKSLGNFNPDSAESKDYLKKVFENNEVKVYEVIN